MKIVRNFGFGSISLTRKSGFALTGILFALSSCGDKSAFSEQSNSVHAGSLGKNRGRDSTDQNGRSTSVATEKSVANPVGGDDGEVIHQAILPESRGSSDSVASEPQSTSFPQVAPATIAAVSLPKMDSVLPKVPDDMGTAIESISEPSAPILGIEGSYVAARPTSPAEPIAAVPLPIAQEPAPAPVVILPAPAPAPVVILPAPAPAPVVILPAPAPAPVVILPAPAPAPVVTAPVPTPAPVVVAPAPSPTPNPAIPHVPEGKTLMKIEVVQLESNAWYKNCMTISLNGKDTIVGCNKDTAKIGSAVYLLADKPPFCNKLKIAIDTYHNQGDNCSQRAGKGLTCNGPYPLTSTVTRSPSVASGTPFFHVLSEGNINKRSPLIRWDMDFNGLKHDMDIFTAGGENNWLRVFFEDLSLSDIDAAKKNPSKASNAGVNFGDYIVDIKGEGVKFTIEGSGLSCQK